MYARRGEPRKAIADYSKQLALTQDDVTPAFNRALLYEQIREFDQAIADYTRVLGNKSDLSRFGGPKEDMLALAYHYRGRAYHWYKKDYDKAIADYNAALELDPRIDMVRYRRGQAYHALRDYESAAADFDAELKRQPDYPNLLQEYAWQLATCPDPRFRDGKRALTMATRGVQLTKEKRPELIDTLAAACAENGRFADAVKWEKRALQLLSAKQTGDRKAMQARLTHYEARQPFREDSTPRTASISTPSG